MAERERCPTCGQPIGTWVPARICAVCHQPIRKGHKWRIEQSTIRHRNCDQPDAYDAGPRFYEKAGNR